MTFRTALSAADQLLRRNFEVVILIDPDEAITVQAHCKGFDNYIPPIERDWDETK